MWQNYYKDLIDKLNNLGAIHQPASNKDKKFVCIDGIGGFLCEEACRVYLDEKKFLKILSIKGILMKKLKN